MSSHLDKAIAEARKTDGIYLKEIMDETSAFLHSSDFERVKHFEHHPRDDLRVEFKSIEANVRAVHSKAFELTNKRITQEDKDKMIRKLTEAKGNFEHLFKHSGGSRRKTHSKKSKKSTKRRRQNGRKSRKV